MVRIRSVFRSSTSVPSTKGLLAVFGFLGAHLVCGFAQQALAQVPSLEQAAPPAVSTQRLPPVDDVRRHPFGVVPASHHESEPEPSSRRYSAESVRVAQVPSGSIKTEVIPPGVPATDTSASLSLADLENLAMQNNPTLVQAVARIQAAQGRWVQGGLRPNPIVGYMGNEIGNDGRSGQQGAFLSQEFVRGGKLGLNRAVASQEIAQVQQEMEAQRRRVLNDVRIEYFNVLVAQRARVLTRELAEIAKQGLETTERLYRGQQVNRPEVLQSKIESASAAVALQNAQNRYAAAWRRLSSVIGTPDMEVHDLAGDLTPQLNDFDWNEAYTRLVNQSPELASARAAIGRARAVLERAQVEPIPNVDVQLGVQYDNSSQFTIGTVQVGVPIPYSNRNQGNVQTAFADVRNAQAEVGRIELSLRNRLALAFETYANARNQVETFTKSILPDARASLDLVALGYHEGQLSFLALLTAQRTNFQANLAYLQAVQELNASRIAIEGLMLTGSLQGETGSIDAPRLTGGMAPVFGPGKPPVEKN